MIDIQNTVEKLDKYYKRLNKGKVQKIKPAHVEKAIKKLKAREKLLLAEHEETPKESKKKRLKNKLEIVREQMKRAEWLLKKIS